MEQDNSVLQEKSHKLQKKTKALAKEKNANHFSLELVVVAVFLVMSFFCYYYLVLFTELKKLVSEK